MYSFMVGLCKFWHSARAWAVARVVESIVATCQARTWEMAQFLARRWGICFKSGLQAVSRTLGNVKVDVWDLGAHLLARLSAETTVVPLAVDWTEWHDDKRVLVAAAVVGKRAIPIAAAGYDKQNMPRSQNARENVFLRLLSRLVHEAKRKVVILTDRGFRRVSWVKLLMDCQLDFAVRLMTDVLARCEGAGGAKPLKLFQLRPGEMVDLGVVELREDRAVKVRVVGIHARGQKEAWWIATSLSTTVADVASWYDRRMGVEEQLRDSKGCRYGVQIYWTTFEQPERIGRLFVLVGFALTVWTIAGIVVASADRTARFPHKIKGPRRSYATIGRQAMAAAGYDAVDLVLQALAHLREHPPRVERRRFGDGLQTVKPVACLARPAGDGET